MKLRQSSVALLAVAIVLATSSALVARNLMRPPEPQKIIVEKQPEPVAAPEFVLVAVNGLQPGDFVDGSTVQWAQMEAAGIRPGEIVGNSADSRRKHEQNLFGATVRQDIEAGKPIMDNLLLRPGSPGFIAAVLSPGMRAISIPISAVTSNAGLVSAGDWVDVILSVERSEAAMMSAESGGLAQANLAAQTILRRVRVLALNSDTTSLAPLSVVATNGQEVSTAAKGAQPQRRNVYETITLEATPDEAERLAVAREAGSLQVVLRSVKDVDTADAELAEGNKDQVTRLHDATSIFVSNKKSKTTAMVQTFHGAKVGAVNF
ncbi:Flp pilus assembly protein CpaB [Pseudodesulfovibrio sp. F-1]|uniref:Flp pilus assembly protein CpaB n=1 Tax=Pseudodesulfovibrio alkaliphilus TaxID=2661613 RepID=A0A7K1KR33_9BACT|nr:Flp pilus assembly protein CpaB [Pseudodesulfovibrio alkaliphilus]MUM78537.1 Flp pilus assembly protein CpaB [Pseudodesulfovibrio alkaliphilus]